MARGRFISNDIIADKEINELSSDTSRLAYIFLITLADCEGRVIGDPVYLASVLFPRRREVTPDMIRSFIIEWINAGFIVWYETPNGEKAIQLINWGKHQKGLRKDREAPTNFPDPKECNVIEIKENLKEVKLREVKGTAPINSGEGREKVGSNQKENIKPARSDFSAFQQVWEQETGHPVSGFTEFTRMCERFEAEGVTSDLYRTAIQEQKQSEYPVKRPTSVEEWAVRLANPPDRSSKNDSRVVRTQTYIDADGNKIEMEV